MVLLVVKTDSSQVGVFLLALFVLGLQGIPKTAQADMLSSAPEQPCVDGFAILHHPATGNRLGKVRTIGNS